MFFFLILSYILSQSNFDLNNSFYFFAITFFLILYVF
jgi:hypothetical protein